MIDEMETIRESYFWAIVSNDGSEETAAFPLAGDCPALDTRHPVARLHFLVLAAVPGAFGLAMTAVGTNWEVGDRAKRARNAYLAETDSV